MASRSPHRVTWSGMSGAHRPEVDRVDVAQPLKPVGRHRHAVVAVVVRAPIERDDLELESIAPRAGIKNLEPGHDHFWANSVARDCRDFVRPHDPPPPWACEMHIAPQPGRVY